MAAAEVARSGLVIEVDRGQWFGSVLAEAGWLPRLANSIDEALELSIARAPELLVINTDDRPADALLQDVADLRAVATRPFPVLATGIRRRVQVLEAIEALDFLTQPTSASSFRQMLDRAAALLERRAVLTRDSATAIGRLAMAREVMNRRDRERAKRLDGYLRRI